MHSAGMTDSCSISNSVNRKRVSLCCCVFGGLLPNGLFDEKFDGLCGIFITIFDVYLEDKRKNFMGITPRQQIFGKNDIRQ